MGSYTWKPTSNTMRRIDITSKTKRTTQIAFIRSKILKLITRTISMTLRTSMYQKIRNRSNIISSAWQTLSRKTTETSQTTSSACLALKGKSVSELVRSTWYGTCCACFEIWDAVYVATWLADCGGGAGVACWVAFCAFFCYGLRVLSDCITSCCALVLVDLKIILTYPELTLCAWGQTISVTRLATRSALYALSSNRISPVVVRAFSKTSVIQEKEILNTWWRSTVLCSSHTSDAIRTTRLTDKVDWRIDKLTSRTAISLASVSSDMLKVFITWVSATRQTVM